MTEVLRYSSKVKAVTDAGLAGPPAASCQNPWSHTCSSPAPGRTPPRCNLGRAGHSTWVRDGWTPRHHAPSAITPLSPARAGRHQAPELVFPLMGACKRAAVIPYPRMRESGKMGCLSPLKRSKLVFGGGALAGQVRRQKFTKTARSRRVLSPQSMAVPT